MTTIVFVHGIANKPSEQDLILSWRRALADDYRDNPGLDLTEYALIRSVHWADVLYPEPAHGGDVAESTGVPSETAAALDGDGPPLDEVEDAYLDALGAALDFDPKALAKDDGATAPSAREVAEAMAEAIPLPWFMKRHLLRFFARDSHHYLFNRTFSPRPGESFAVRDEIRSRFLRVVSEAAEAGPVVILSHSMGTVISYDCLANLPDCPEVAHLVTVGSPLGMSEMQDKLAPGYSRHDGYPRKVRGTWTNVYDPVDIVSRADARIANDFQRDGAPALTDLRQNNGGAWTHAMTRYAAEAPLRDTLRAALE